MPTQSGCYRSDQEVVWPCHRGAPVPAPQLAGALRCVAELSRAYVCVSRSYFFSFFLLLFDLKRTTVNENILLVILHNNME